MPSSFDRRTFLSRSAMAAGGLAVAGSAGSILAACGSSGGSDSSATTAAGGGAADFGTLTYQLSWYKNVEFAGPYIADTEGLYTKAGFSGVKLLAGGPTVTQDAVVASGKALVGISAPDITSAAILKGAPLIAIGALFQKNPFCVMSLASNPLKTPKDMIGKKIGVQAVNEPVWNAFLKANDLDPSKITKVPAQFSPDPLAAGEVDGWFSFFTNEPNLLKAKGVETISFLLNDYNYPLVSQIWVVKTDTLKNDRDKLKAFLKADVTGWQKSLADPAIGPNLVVTKYGKDLKLDEAEQVLESKAQNTLIVSADTKLNGIGTITPEIMDETIATLAAVGSKISAEKLFDLSILEEMYDENPDLKTA